jgi:hypothetical protein
LKAQAENEGFSTPFELFFWYSTHIMNVVELEGFLFRINACNIPD